MIVVPHPSGRLYIADRLAFRATGSHVDAWGRRRVDGVLQNLSTGSVQRDAFCEGPDWEPEANIVAHAMVSNGARFDLVARKD